MNHWRRFPTSPGRVLAAGLASVLGWLGLSLSAAQTTAAGSLALEAVHRVTASNGVERLVAQSHLEFEKLKPEAVAFLAVATNVWPAGLVPIFAVEKSGRIELRRLPAAGMESSSEPVFFALPPEDEAENSRVTGRWECRAIRGNNTDHLAWDLTIDGERLAGRFDQTQEYRVATIAGGIFRSNRLELRVEYFMDHYVLNGVWRNGRLSGDWRHVDDSERGIWEATQSPSKVVHDSGVKLTALYEWRRAGSEVRRYAFEQEKFPPEWRRTERPLCRVWWRSPGE